MARGAYMHGGAQRALTISAVLTGVYFVVELGAGILIGSVAVISDAGAGDRLASITGALQQAVDATTAGLRYHLETGDSVGTEVPPIASLS